jgi:hypothetical protein
MNVPIHPTHGFKNPRLLKIPVFADAHLQGRSMMRPTVALSNKFVIGLI